MATKLERQKEFVGYRTKPSTCGGCKYFTSVKKPQHWMEKSGYSQELLESCAVEKELRCTLHGFAVRKTAVCNNFEGT